MSLNPDVLIGQYIARALADRTGHILVAPPIQYGYRFQVRRGGGNFLPGTTSVSGSALQH